MADRRKHGPGISRFRVACREVQDYCDRYFKSVAIAAAAGNIHRAGHAVLPAYPTMMLAYELKDGYAFELLGSMKEYKKLSVVRRKAKSIDEVLGHFKAAQAKSMISAQNANISNMRLASKMDVARFDVRYPGMSTLHKTIIQYGGDLPEGVAFNAISLKDAVGTFWLNNVLTVNSYQEFVRMRYFQTLVVLGRGSNALRVFENFFPLDGDLHLVVPLQDTVGSEQLNRAANFASLASVNTPETTVGKFLEQNRDILLSSLNARDIIPQPKLKWVKVISSNDRVSIIPDFIFIDHQGNAHLCDLKLPLLDRGSLTKGGRSRRRFIDNVAEGIAQLANYEEYFLYPENAAYALEHYGIRVTNPRKVLIVGSFENFNTDEVLEANRERGIEAPEILDYDTVRNAYLINEGVV